MGGCGGHLAPTPGRAGTEPRPLLKGRANPAGEARGAAGLCHSRAAWMPGSQGQKRVAPLLGTSQGCSAAEFLRPRDAGSLPSHEAQAPQLPASPEGLHQGGNTSQVPAVPPRGLVPCPWHFQPAWLSWHHWDHLLQERSGQMGKRQLVSADGFLQSHLKLGGGLAGLRAALGQLCLGMEKVLATAEPAHPAPRRAPRRAPRHAPCHALHPAPRRTPRHVPSQTPRLPLLLFFRSITCNTRGWDCAVEIQRSTARCHSLALLARSFSEMALTLSSQGAGTEKDPRLIKSFGLFGKIYSCDRAPMTHLRLCH